MIISFFGHRSLYKCDELFEKIERAIINSAIGSEKIVFFCGGYGDFDNLCAKVCKSIKGKHKNCEIVLVTPYLTQTQEKTKNETLPDLYDATVYPPLENIPPKFAIIKRNEWMIDQSDMIIAYVEHSYGGAYQSLHYARRKGKPIINLASKEHHDF